MTTFTENIVTVAVETTKASLIVHQCLYFAFPTASVPLSPDQQTTLYRTFVLLLKSVLLSPFSNGGSKLRSIPVFLSSHDSFLSSQGAPSC